MKKIYNAIIIIAVTLIGCDPIEDNSHRKAFENVGIPISQEELDAAISVTQPIPNEDNKVAGDQYVVLKNNRPDIGGVWHLGWSTGEKIVGTDNDTVIYDANGDYEIYYTGVSSNRIVTSKKFKITVTNCFDDYDRLLCGAVNKADKAAKKTWKFLPVSGALYDGEYGFWKRYEPTPGKYAWEPLIDISTLTEQTMTLEFDGHRMTTYTAQGAVSKVGTWGYTHEKPEKVIGEFVSTIPVIGTNTGWSKWKGAETPYWILHIAEDKLILCLPFTHKKPATTNDWDISATYFFLVPVK